MPNMLLEISGEITPERMKRWSQSENNTQLWMGLVMEVKSDAAKNNIAQEPGMLEPRINVNLMCILGINKCYCCSVILLC